MIAGDGLPFDWPREMLLCSCGHHALEFLFFDDHDEVEDEHYRTVQVTFWNNGRHSIHKGEILETLVDLVDHGWDMLKDDLFRLRFRDFWGSIRSGHSYIGGTFGRFRDAYYAIKRRTPWTDWIACSPDSLRQVGELLISWASDYSDVKAPENWEFDPLYFIQETAYEDTNPEHHIALLCHLEDYDVFLDFNMTIVPLRRGKKPDSWWAVSRYVWDILVHGQTGKSSIALTMDQAMELGHNLILTAQHMDAINAEYDRQHKEELEKKQTLKEA